MSGALKYLVVVLEKRGGSYDFCMAVVWSKHGGSSDFCRCDLTAGGVALYGPFPKLLATLSPYLLPLRLSVHAEGPSH